MPKVEDKEKKPAAVDKPPADEKNETATTPPPSTTTSTTPAKTKYLVKGGNIKYQKVWYKEGQSLQLTNEELEKLPGEVKEKLKKGGE